MPFKNQRNSRDDNSKKQRSSSTRFQSKGSSGRKNTPFKEENPFGKPSYEREDNKTYGKPAKFSKKPSFGKEENNNSGKTSNFGKRPSFGKEENETSGRPPRFNKKPSFGKEESKTYGKSANFGKRPSFAKEENEASGKPPRFNKKPSFGKEESKTYGKSAKFSKPSNRFGDRPTNKFSKNSGEPSTNKFEKTEGTEDTFKYTTRRKFVATKKPATAQMNDDGLIRLNRYIANSGICSRRKADELIAAGVISVNGQVITELGTRVDPAKDEIRYNNERLKREKMVYVLLNKPKDYITTTDDPQERHTVMHLVAKATRERVYPVGRLDRNTTGLLLLTNDGNLAEKLSHPRNNISKIYRVELNKNLKQGDFNKIEFGLELEDGFIKPDDLSYVQGASKNEIGIQIHSGKNRIVRRIFESLGYEIVKLDRVVYANLTKKDLPRGRWRYLEERELVQLKHFVK